MSGIEFGVQTPCQNTLTNLMSQYPAAELCIASPDTVLIGLNMIDTIKV